MPFSNLTAAGTVSYSVGGNTYEAGPAFITKSIVGTPVKDKANRTVMYVKWKIVAEDVISSTPPATVNAQLEVLRAIFSRNRGKFLFETKGFGGFTINSPFGGSKDIMFGPEVKLTVLKQQLYFARVQLEFEVNLAPCVDAIPKGVMAATYSVRFDIEGGYTKRIFDGEIVVALVPEGNRLLDNADNYREQFVPDLPKGFRRERQSFSVNSTKNTLSINVVDAEFESENVYPPGCVSAKLQHSMGNAGAMQFCLQEGNLSATYEMAKGVDLGLGLFHFKKAVKRFFHDLILEAVPPNVKVEKEKRIGLIGTVIPLRTFINLPDRYGKPIIEVRMSASVITSPTLFFAGGMNKPIPDSNEDLWKASVTKAQSPRGNANLGLENDIIYDLCTRFQPFAFLNKKRQLVPVKAPAIKAIVGDSWPLPNPANSWLKVSLGYVLQPVDRVVRSMPLQSDTSTSSLKTPNLAQRNPFKDIAALPVGSNPEIYQTISASQMDVIFTGVMIRAGYPCPVPTIRSFMGMSVIPANTKDCYFMQVEDPLLGPIPIYFAKWFLRFMVTPQKFSLTGGWQSNPTLRTPPAMPPQGNPAGLGGGNLPATNPATNSVFGNLFGNGGLTGLINGNE